jgi:uncharacterized protein DUF3810
VLWRAILVIAAAAVAVVPLPQAFIERHYSARVFPPVQHWVTGLSNSVDVALFDLLIVGAALWWVGAIIIDIAGRRPFPRVFLRIFPRTITAAAVVYLVFAAMWGLNYRRLPLTERITFDEQAITPAASRELARQAADEVNALYVAAHSELALTGRITGRSLESGFEAAQHALRIERPALPAHPKRTLLDPYFRAAGIDGMTDPFFLETLVVRGLLPFEEPFVIAHEWSHLVGFTDEGEANFVGWLACLRGSDAAKYSGWLFLYSQAIASMPASDRAAVEGRLRPGPRRDLEQIVERVKRQVSPRVSAAGWRVYDQYLKANRVEAGTASYAQVIRLVLGSRSAGLF